MSWPSRLYVDFPELHKESNTADFARAVFEYQLRYKLTADGKLGRKTLVDMSRRYEPVGDMRLYAIQGGVRFPLDWLEEDSEKKCTDILMGGVPHPQFRTWEQKGGLDLHRNGGWRKGGKDRQFKRIVLHWGGLDVKHCKIVLENRDLSSHIGIDNTGAYQWLDLQHVAYHAGSANGDSIGIDICQQPTLKWKTHYEQALMMEGLNRIQVVRNPCVRGDKQVLSLHLTTAELVRRTVSALCELFDIPFAVPRTATGEYDNRVVGLDFHGVMGHHHLSPGKWDIAPWWEQLWNSTDIG